MTGRKRWQDGWFGYFVTLGALFVGALSLVGAVVAGRQGHWVLVALYVPVIAVCLRIVVPELLEELIGSVMLALMVLSLPLLLFPRGRRWWGRVWGGATRDVGKALLGVNDSGPQRGGDRGGGGDGGGGEVAEAGGGEVGVGAGDDRGDDRAVGGEDGGGDGDDRVVVG